MKKKPHILARTTVDVYRLFKVHDAGRALAGSGDGVVASLGRSVHVEAEVMLQQYIAEQDKLNGKKVRNKLRRQKRKVKR